MHILTCGLSFKAMISFLCCYYYHLNLAIHVEKVIIYIHHLMHAAELSLKPTYLFSCSKTVIENVTIPFLLRTQSQFTQSLDQVFRILKFEDIFWNNYSNNTSVLDIFDFVITWNKTLCFLQYIANYQQCQSPWYYKIYHGTFQLC